MNESRFAMHYCSCEQRAQGWRIEAPPATRVSRPDRFEPCLCRSRAWGTRGSEPSRRGGMAVDLPILVLDRGSTSCGDWPVRLALPTFC